MNKLDQIRAMTTIVVDTGDIESIKAHQPTDATTNPSLILAAAQKPQYRHLIEGAVRGEKSLVMDQIFVGYIRLQGFRRNGC